MELTSGERMEALIAIMAEYERLQRLDIENLNATYQARIADLKSAHDKIQALKPTE